MQQVWRVSGDMLGKAIASAAGHWAWAWLVLTAEMGEVPTIPCVFRASLQVSSLRRACFPWVLATGGLDRGSGACQ